MVKEYDTIIRSQKKDILNVAYRQGKIFKKIKVYGKILEMIKEIGVSKSTMYLKTKLLKTLGKCPKLKRLYFSLKLFSDNSKTIKETCKESESKFK